MFTMKNRIIANQKAMIENRDKLIEGLQEKNDYYKNVSEAQREDLLNQDVKLKEVLELAEGNTYNNEKIVLSKIIEVIRRQTK